MGSTILTLAMLAATTSALCVQQPTLQRDNRNGNPQTVIHDPAEYREYSAAFKTQDPAQRGAALEAFTRHYPKSVAFLDALEQAMAAFQQAGNQAKVLEVGRKILEGHPHNLRAMAMVVGLDRATATANGPGAQGAMKEACSYAQTGLEEMPQLRQGNMSAADFEKLRSQMTSIFSGAAGNCALQNKNYAAARAYFDHALEIDPSILLNVYEMAITELEMNPIEANGFWYCAKAVNLAEQQKNTQGSVNGIADYCKGKYKAYHGSEEGWDGIIARAATEKTPPSQPLVTRQPTPAESAVQAARQKDLATLSFPDWKLVLSQRDASPANKDAADKVWQSIQAREKNGQAKLTIKAKVISASKDTIHAAVLPDDQQANKEDLEVTLDKPIVPPAPGATVQVVGLAQGYTASPFLFTMTQGEIPGATPATQLSEADIEKLLHGKVTLKRVAELVKQKGVDFTLDDAAEGRLRKAGATNELLLTIATAKKD